MKPALYRSFAPCGTLRFSFENGILPLVLAYKPDACALDTSPQPDGVVMLGNVSMHGVFVNNEPAPLVRKGKMHL